MRQVDLSAVVGDQIEVQSARPPMHIPSAVGVSLDPMQSRKELLGFQVGFEKHHRVEEPALDGASDRVCLV